MGKPYGDDVKKRVAVALAGRTPVSVIAETENMSQATIRRWRDNKELDRFYKQAYTTKRAEAAVDIMAMMQRSATGIAEIQGLAVTKILKAFKKGEIPLREALTALGITSDKLISMLGVLPRDDSQRREWHSIKDVAASVWSEYRWTKFHTFIACKAEEFISKLRYGLKPFVILTVPSQHGKSMLTRYLGAAIVAQMPHLKGGYISHGAAFAKRNGCKPIRDMLREHQPQLFDKDPKKDEYQGDFWRTKYGGGMLAGSPQSGVVGETLDFAIFDDLHKNYTEYKSEACHIRLRDFLEGVGRQRLNNRSGVWVISTRWGKGDGVDLCKEILGGDRVPIHINLPALAEENDPLGREIDEPLFPYMHSLESLLATKAIIHPFKWAAMYRGNPQALTGDFFDYGAWVTLPEMPHEPQLRRPCRYWDLAFTKGGHGCVGVLGQTTPPEMTKEQANTVGETFGRVYIQDMLELRNDWPVNQERIIRQAREDGPGTIVGVEANGPQVALAQLIKKRLGDDFDVWFRTSKPDKETDAQTWQLEQQQGRIVLIGNGDTEAFKKQADKFPQEDIDKVDAISGLIWVNQRLAVFEGLAG